MSQYQTIPSMYESIINNHFLNDPPPQKTKRKMFTFSSYPSHLEQRYAAKQQVYHLNTQHFSYIPISFPKHQILFFYIFIWDNIK